MRSARSGRDVARLDDGEPPRRRPSIAGPQLREAGRGERERADAGGDQRRHARRDRRGVERPLLDVDRRGAALAAQRLAEEPPAHAAGLDDRRDRTSAAGGPACGIGASSPIRATRPAGWQRERVEHALRRGEHDQLGAVGAQLREQLGDAPHDDVGPPARVGRVGVVAQQQQVLPGQQPLQGAGDRDPAGILGEDADGAVRDAQARGRVFSGS